MKKGLNEPKISIIILNWNNKDDTIKCLDSLRYLNYNNYEIIVIDNGSTDGSQKEIRKRFSDVKLIENKENLGFAEGNNIGIQKALEDEKIEYLFLLNNDTTIEPDILKELVKVAESDSKIGMLQPKMLRMDNPDIIDSTGHIFKFGKIIDRGVGEIDRGQYDNKLDIIGCCAGACLYKREMFKDVGLFDKSFFLYYEDAELSWRAYKKGWKAKHIPSAIVYHKRGGTIKKDKGVMQELINQGMINISMTVRMHGNLRQKLLFSLKLTFEGVCSGIGKRLGRNKVGSKPYFEGLRVLIWGERL